MNLISLSSLIIAIIMHRSNELILKFTKSLPHSISTLSDIYHNYLGVELCFGAPEQQCLILNLDQSAYALWLIDNESKSKSSSQIGFDRAKSHSISFKHEFQVIYNYDKFERAYSSLDTVFLYKQPDSPRMNDFFFLLSDTFTEVEMNSGVIGLSIQNNIYQETIGSNFIDQLKKKNLISSYQYIIHYTSEEGGELIIGEGFNVVDDDDDKSELVYLKPIPSGIALKWGLEIDKIQSGNSGMVHHDQKAALKIELGFIIGSEEYGEYLYVTFFKKYLDMAKCSYEAFKSNYFGYSCDNEVSSIDLSIFEPLIFTIGNYAYEFEAKDLFKTIDHTVYFLIIFPRRGFYYVNYDWILGEPFYRKYTMTFDQDKKQIGIYTPKSSKILIPQNNDSNTKDNDSISLTLMILISLSGVALGLFIVFIVYVIYKKAYGRRRNQMKMIDYSIVKD